MSSITSEPGRPHDAPAELRAWLNACHLRLTAPSLIPRCELVLHGEVIGSLHPDVHADSALFWPPTADATEALALWAHHLCVSGRCGSWRDELLSVRRWNGGASSEPLAAVERGAARVLGIQTEAVHLVGFTDDGRVWLQQRALDKANDPGLWDTLVGGLVAHGETVTDTLQRETWEEAGLRLHALKDLWPGGTFHVTKPSEERGGLGYMRETLYWFTAVVPAGMAPVNQDGEVARFEALQPDAVCARVLAGQCTDEAAWVLAKALGWPLPLSDL